MLLLLKNILLNKLDLHMVSDLIWDIKIESIIDSNNVIKKILQDKIR